LKEGYRKQVDLLLDVIEIALADKRVALKGGTAINLFLRDFPRYSVDIDLCYLPIEERTLTFKHLQDILLTIKARVEKDLKYKVAASNTLDGKKEVKLVVSSKDVEIKIEPNFTLRGGLFEPEVRSLSPRAVKELKREISVQCLSMADTYGGKICAALDRQHPRDLYDVKYLFENEGITEKVKDSFIYYLISHNRPLDELLNPNFKDITDPFAKEFVEMAMEEVSVQDLLQSRERLVKEIRSALNDRDKKFLLGFVVNKPNWTLVRDAKIKDYPSVKWKLFNQEKMSETKRTIYLNNVETLFEKF
jgi:predicted nucleotidyltransferase component of viral defense system